VVVNRAGARLRPLPPMVEDPVEERGPILPTLVASSLWRSRYDASSSLLAAQDPSHRRQCISIVTARHPPPPRPFTLGHGRRAPLLRSPRRGPWREGIVGGCHVPGFWPWEEVDWCILGVATMFLACCNWLFSCSNHLSFMLQSLNMLYPRS
jgi:hypothetical protein